jgi:WD40 repeat protein
LSVERSALSVERSPAAAAGVDSQNPWPGLAPFTEAESSHFHGRDEEIRTLLRLIERKPLTVLFGQSGLGKSSLLQAGVFPQLRATAYCPSYIRLDHSEGAPPPAEQVKAFIRDASARAGTWTKPGVAQPGESLWEFFHHRDDRLVDKNGRTIIPVLVIDQFEELFTLGAGVGAQRDRAVAFMTALAELVENRVSDHVVARLEQSPDDLEAFDFARTDYRVCLSLREDFLPHLESLAEIMPALMENRMRLTRMTGTQALAAVIKPGAGLVNETVARAIVEFVAGARGGSAERLAELTVEPPLLSVICHELNERRRSRGLSQITADLVTGNRREILTDFYERSVADLPDGMRRFVEDKLLTKSGFRDNLALETALEEPGVTQPLIDTLVTRRLLRIEDRIGAQRVELTHDVLADVIRAARDARQQRVALEQAQARERFALEHAARHTRRQRWVIAGLVAAVVALSTGAVFGIRAQRRAAAQAGHTDMVLGSRLLDEGKLVEGMTYLVRAGRKDPANDLVAPRLLSLLSSRSFLLPAAAPLALPVPALSATYTADDRWIFVQGEDDVVRIIDAVEWRLVREVDFGQKVRRGGLALAEKNSGVFAVILEDNSILVCDTATGQPRGRPLSVPERILGSSRSGAVGHALRFSPDGRWVAARGTEAVWLWDAATGELLLTRPQDSPRRGFAFSPDSRMLATTQGTRITLWSIPDRVNAGPEFESPNPDNASDWNSLTFSGDGRRLLLWNAAGVQVSDTATGTPIAPLIPLNGPATTGLWPTQDGKKMIYTTANRTAVVLDVATGKPLFPPLAHGGHVGAFGARLVADDRILFTNSVDGMQRFWNLETGKLLAEPTLRQPQYVAATVSSDAKNMVVFTASGPAYRLRVGGRPAAPLAVLRTAESMRNVNFAPGSPTQLRWVSSTAVRDLDVTSGRESGSGFNLPEPITRFSRSPYGGTLGPKDVVMAQTRPETPWRAWILGENNIASDVGLEDSSAIIPAGVDSSLGFVAGVLEGDRTRLVVWDAKTGRRIVTITAGVSIFTNNTNVFSPDGKRVMFMTTDFSVHVCELGTGQEAFVLQLSGRGVIRSFRYSPDGNRILTGDTWGGIQIWEAATGRQLRSTQHHRTIVQRFDFSGDRRFYASLSADGTAQVWDAATDQPVGALMEQNGTANRADFSPDNTRVITPSTGGAARIWDVRTGLPVTDPLDTEGDVANTVAFSPDGRFVDVHGFANIPRQHVRLWSVPPSGGNRRTPEWLLTLATLCAGHRITDEGKLVDATESLAKIEEVQRALAEAPANDPYAEWARWILSESTSRPIAPGFTITPAEAKKLRMEFGGAVLGAPGPGRTAVPPGPARKGKKKQ